jgi:hypothetical protein
MRAVALVACFTLSASGAHAFKCTRVGDTTGPSQFWLNRTVTMQRSGEGHEVKAADIERVMKAAGDTWSNIACSDVAEVVGAATDDRVIGFDWSTGVGSPANHNIVVFRNDSSSDPLDTWEHDLAFIAITTVTFENASGQILDADVELNDAGFDFTACDSCTIHSDLQNTLTHELGHVLGLDHTPVEDATMFFSAPEGDTSKRTLADDDTQGICAIYPAGQPAGNCYPDSPRASPPKVTFTETLCGAGGGPTPIVVLAVLIRTRQLRRR